MNDNDTKFIRMAIDVARKAREKGNHPFGAILVDGDGQVIMEAENSVVQSKDCTGHAEINLIRETSARYDQDFLSKCTLYASTEPCPMCSGAIFWSNLRRVVYGLSGDSFYEMTGEIIEEVLHLSCRDVLAKGNKAIEVIGPMLEEEAREVHRGFWR
jgi:tRNA(Arg) A34 adenosine deaminase TadA